MSYTLASIPKVGANPGRPRRLQEKMIIFRLEDIENLPSIDANGVKATGDLTFKSGKTAAYIYLTPSTIVVMETSSGDPDKKGFIHKVEAQHPGDGLLMSEFVNNNINENLGVLIMDYDGTNRRLLGLSAPLQIASEKTISEEGKFTALTLESILPGDAILHYEGQLPWLDGGSGSGVI